MLEFLFAVAPILTILIAVTASIIFVSGIDDIAYDLAFAAMWISRRFSKDGNSHHRVTREVLEEVPERQAAIMVPLWQEAGVVGHMIDHAIEVLNYENYTIFIGVYPNDEQTLEVVQICKQIHGNRVQIAVLPHPGPTSKSDNLNYVLEEVYSYENRTGTQFELFVLNDAEDLVPKDELKLINYYIGKYDVVQISVFPIKMKWHELTAGHYMDEFAQLHLKDMPTREWLTGSIPCAGVGAAFSRKSIQLLAKLHEGEVFNRIALTEDYVLPLELSRQALNSHFVLSKPVILEERKSWAGRDVVEDPSTLVAVREYFPRKFSAAVRQKTRWVLGIALQGWDNLGWSGDPSYRFLLYRDRKVLWNNIVNVIGYVLVAIILAAWYLNYAHDDPTSFPVIVQEGSWIWYLLICNLVILTWRLVVRAWCTFQIYGPFHAILSVPRAVWGNFINFVATVRALAIYYTARRKSNRQIPWEKTEHEFPPTTLR